MDRCEGSFKQQSELICDDEKKHAPLVGNRNSRSNVYTKHKTKNRRRLSEKQPCGTVGDGLRAPFPGAGGVTATQPPDLLLWTCTVQRSTAPSLARVGDGSLTASQLTNHKATNTSVMSSECWPSNPSAGYPGPADGSGVKMRHNTPGPWGGAFSAAIACASNKSTTERSNITVSRGPYGGAVPEEAGWQKHHLGLPERRYGEIRKCLSYKAPPRRWPRMARSRSRAVGSGGFSPGFTSAIRWTSTRASSTSAPRSPQTSS